MEDIPAAFPAGPAGRRGRVALWGYALPYLRIVAPLRRAVNREHLGVLAHGKPDGA